MLVYLEIILCEALFSYVIEGISSRVGAVFISVTTSRKDARISVDFNQYFPAWKFKTPPYWCTDIENKNYKGEVTWRNVFMIIQVSAQLLLRGGTRHVIDKTFFYYRPKIRTLDCTVLQFPLSCAFQLYHVSKDTENNSLLMLY